MLHLHWPESDNGHGTWMWPCYMRDDLIRRPSFTVRRFNLNSPSICVEFHCFVSQSIVLEVSSLFFSPRHRGETRFTTPALLGDRARYGPQGCGLFENLEDKHVVCEDGEKRCQCHCRMASFHLSKHPVGNPIARWLVDGLTRTDRLSRDLTMPGGQSGRPIASASFA